MESLIRYEYTKQLMFISQPFRYSNHTTFTMLYKSEMKFVSQVVSSIHMKEYSKVEIFTMLPLQSKVSGPQDNED